MILGSCHWASLGTSEYETQMYWASRREVAAKVSDEIKEIEQNIAQALNSPRIEEEINLALYRARLVEKKEQLGRLLQR